MPRPTPPESPTPTPPLPAPSRSNLGSLLASFFLWAFGLAAAAGVAGVDWAKEKGEKKQAATSVAARFLYMVFLYMAPDIEQNKTRRGAGLR